MSTACSSTSLFAQPEPGHGPFQAPCSCLRMLLIVSRPSDLQLLIMIVQPYAHCSETPSTCDFLVQGRRLGLGWDASRLPEDILRIILQQLHPEELRGARSVCKAWHSTATSCIFTLTIPSRVSQPQSQQHAWLARQLRMLQQHAHSLRSLQVAARCPDRLLLQLAPLVAASCTTSLHAHERPGSMQILSTAQSQALSLPQQLISTHDCPCDGATAATQPPPNGPYPSVKSTAMPLRVSLQELHLLNCRDVTDAGLQALCRHVQHAAAWDIQMASSAPAAAVPMNGATQLQCLQVLAIQHASQISARGASQLLLSLPQLQSLDVTGCSSISWQGIARRAVETGPGPDSLGRHPLSGRSDGGKRDGGGALAASTQGPLVLEPVLLVAGARNSSAPSAAQTGMSHLQRPVASCQPTSDVPFSKTLVASSNASSHAATQYIHSQLQGLSVTWPHGCSSEGAAELHALMHVSRDLTRLSIHGCHMLTNDALAVLNQPLGAPAPHTWALPPCAGSLRSSEHADLSSAEVNDIVTITGGLPTSGTSMSSEVAVAMIGSGLRHLSLHGAWAVGDRGLTAIASLTGLQALQMTELVHVSDVGVLALSALTHLSRLLLDVPVGVRVVTLQEMLPSLSGLLELDLRCVAWDDAATATLCQLPVLQAFKVRECRSMSGLAMRRLKGHLTLRSITVEDASCLLAHSVVVHAGTHAYLTSLTVNGLRFGSPNRNAITRLAAAQSLSTLSMTHCCDLGDFELGMLAGAMPALKCLDISHAGRVTDEGVARACARLSQLRVLALAGTEVTGSFACGLVRPPPVLPNKSSGVPERGDALGRVAEWTFCVQVEDLDLSGCACLGLEDCAAFVQGSSSGGMSEGPGSSAQGVPETVGIDISVRAALAALIARLRVLRVTGSAWADVPNGGGLLPPLPSHIRVVS